MINIKKTEYTHPLTWRLRSDNKPVWLSEYITKYGYQGAKKALAMHNKMIIDIVEQSKLRGRGGSGFFTSYKWLATLKNTVDSTGYLICNADEMEPGTYKDRVLLEQLPHLLIEGMLISAYALNINKGYIFLRCEYHNELNNLNYAINEALDNNLLGKNILDSNFNFELITHSGAGRYISGEETALINSLEGRRANPRYKPPFPTDVGLWGKPTCINNVETLCNIPAIVLYGSNWYRSISINNSSDHGTKLMGFSGHVNNPGLWEVPFGIIARNLLEDYAEGIIDNKKLKAWLPGGISTALLLDKHLDVPMDFANISNVGSRLGTAMAIAIDDSTNIIELVCNIEEFFSRESCGLCTPCREGLPWIVKLLKSIRKCQSTKHDILTLKQLCSTLMYGKSFCAHAPGAIEPLRSAIKYFYSEFKLELKQ
ncbi:MAG: NADH-quinone oxidoreductase subunit NuoF [Candidatus Lightella neohaematopini]|nr:NADH-quinone oxidoreductase subunit NuoF [Candidatus Lightella neohaematopini]